MASAAARSGLRSLAARAAPLRRRMSSSAHDDACETPKWKNITYAGIVACTLPLLAYPYVHLSFLRKVMHANEEVAQKNGVVLLHDFKFSLLHGGELKVHTYPLNSSRWRGSSGPGPDGLFEKKDHH